MRGSDVPEGKIEPHLAPERLNLGGVAWAVFEGARNPYVILMTIYIFMPLAQTGAFFGVYGLSGVATAWLAPALVALGTRASDSQKGGFAMIVVLLLVGLIGLTFVRGGGREASGPSR
jgi:UMF1 family MFS transporter